MRILLLISLFASLLSACQPVSEGRKVYLEALDLEIILDENISFEEVAGGYVFIDTTRQNTRHPRSFQIAKGANKEVDFDQKEDLEGLKLFYSSSVSQTGSSGPEVSLKGWAAFPLEQRTIEFEAWEIISEGSSPTSSWALPYLRTLNAQGQ